MNGYHIKTLLVATAVGATACFGDEQWHVEQRQYQPDSTLTREIMLSTLSGTRPTLLIPSFGEGRNQFI
jgi:hypothetical protein